MYVSYGLNVAIGIATFIISYVIFNFTLKAAFIAIIVALVILPFVLRWARNIYINMFVSYDQFQNSIAISDFWDKSFISIAESKNIIFNGIIQSLCQKDQA
jgi:hypothetical protein